MSGSTSGRKPPRKATTTRSARARGTTASVTRLPAGSRAGKGRQDGRHATKRSGRPHGLTQQRFRVIVEMIKAGNYAQVAAAAAGIGNRVFYYWLERGRNEVERRAVWEKDNGQEWSARADPDFVEEEEIFVQFVLAVEQAEGHAETALVERVTVDQPLQVLERRFRSRWSRSETREVALSGPSGGPLQFDIGLDTAAKALVEMHKAGALTEPEKEDGSEDHP